MDPEEDSEELRYRLAHPCVKTYAATLLQYLREHGVADETDVVEYYGGGDYCVLYHTNDGDDHTRWIVTCLVSADEIFIELIDDGKRESWLSLPPDALAAACNELQRLLALMERHTRQ